MNWLLRKLSLSPNAYYSYRKRRGNAKEKTKRKASTLKTISALYHESEGSIGYRQMKELLAGQGIHLSAQTVHRYMNKELGLRSVTRKPRYHYVKGPAPDEIFDDLLDEIQSSNNKIKEVRKEALSLGLMKLYNEKDVDTIKLLGKRIDKKIIDSDDDISAIVNWAKYK